MLVNLPTTQPYPLATPFPFAPVPSLAEKLVPGSGETARPHALLRPGVGEKGAGDCGFTFALVRFVSLFLLIPHGISYAVRSGLY